MAQAVFARIREQSSGLGGPVDLARFESTVKVPTEGSRRTSRHPGRRFLFARYANVRACTPPEVLGSGSPDGGGYRFLRERGRPECRRARRGGHASGESPTPIVHASALKRRGRDAPELKRPPGPELPISTSIVESGEFVPRTLKR